MVHMIYEIFIKSGHTAKKGDWIKAITQFLN